MALIKLLLLNACIWALLALSFIYQSDVLKHWLVQINIVAMAVFCTLATAIMIIRYVYASLKSAKVVVVPEFKLEKVRFYELGMLLDNDLSVRDVLSILVFYTFNRPNSPDIVEARILQSLSPHTLATVYRIYERGKSTEEEREAGVLSFLLDSIKIPVTTVLQKHGYFRFSPNIVKSFGKVLVALTLVPLIIALTQLGFVVELFTVIAMWMFVVGAVVYLTAPLFYENLGKLMGIKAKAKGYEMFLSRVEWHTVERSDEAAINYLPYFILFGLKTERFNDMVELALKRLQTTATFESPLNKSAESAG